MEFQIKNRWSGAVQFECELEGEVAGWSYGLRLGFAVKKAIEARAVLTGAVLTGADLTGADLTRAVLTDADLTRAVLTDAVLTGADLTGADLTRAVLTGADLTRAVLTGADLTRAVLTGADLTDADLTGAVLTGADLTGADLTPIRDDIWAVLSSAPAEVPGLLAALRDGRVDGSTYTGECACLVGTIANVRGVDFSDLQGLAPNSGRPAEVFFMGIGRGDTPETSPRAKLAAEWVEDWLTRMQMTFGGASKAVASETAVP